MASFANYDSNKDRASFVAGSGIKIDNTTNRISNDGVLDITSAGNGVLRVNIGGTNKNLTVYTLPKGTSLGDIIVGKLNANGNVIANGDLAVKYDSDTDASAGVISKTTPQIMAFIPKPDNEPGNSFEFGAITEAGIWSLCPTQATDDLRGSSPLYLGTATNRWKGAWIDTVITQNPINTTSDRNMKRSIKGLDDRYLQFFLDLMPVSFIYKEAINNVTHVGFIAQDVEEALNSNGLTADEMGIITKIENSGEAIYSLGYQEFISIITYVVQKLYSRVSSIEDRLSRLEENDGN